MFQVPEPMLIPGGDAGVEIAVLDFGGRGPAILLNHANGFCAALWEPVALDLREQFRVFAMDARGHGDSTKPSGAEHYAWAALGRDVGAVARRIANEHGRLALGMGHSFGGTCLALASREDSALFERILLVDPPYPPPRAQREAGFGRGNAMAEGARRRKRRFPDRQAARERWSGRSMFASWTPRAVELYVAFGLKESADGGVALKCPAEVEATLFEGGVDCDLADRPNELETRLRFLWAKGGNASREHFESLAAELPNADVEAVDAGHLVLMERPELVTEAALRFTSASEGRVSSSPSSLR